jgi:hypothetical protein
MLDKAHRVLHEQARRIGDARLQRSFLEDVPIHRVLEAAWTARHTALETPRRRRHPTVIGLHHDADVARTTIRKK